MTEYIKVRRNRPKGLSLREAFLWYMQPMPDDDTPWIWPGAVDQNDYGIMSYNGVRRRTHIISYELFVGPTNGLLVCHTDDIPRDCNPRNLFLATNAENQKDRENKGRPIGRGRIAEIKPYVLPSFPDHCYEKRVKRVPKRRVMTQEIADKMKLEYSTGLYSTAELGRMYGITQSWASQIINGTTKW